MSVIPNTGERAEIEFPSEDGEEEINRKL